MIPEAAAIIGSLCAIITTIGALYFHRKNYMLHYEEVHKEHHPKDKHKH